MQKSYTVKLSQDAIDSLVAAKNYYNNCKPNLGKKFIANYMTAIKKLKRNPFYKIQYNDIRCIMIPKFQDRIHYFVNEEKQIIFILDVIHCKLNPDDNWLW